MAQKARQPHIYLGRHNAFRQLNTLSTTQAPIHEQSTTSLASQQNGGVPVRSQSVVSMEKLAVTVKNETAKTSASDVQHHSMPMTTHNSSTIQLPAQHQQHKTGAQLSTELRQHNFQFGFREDGGVQGTIIEKKLHDEKVKQLYAQSGFGSGTK